MILDIKTMTKIRVQKCNDTHFLNYKQFNFTLEIQLY